MENQNLLRSFINVHISMPEELSDIAVAFLSDFPFAGIEEKMDELVICFKSIDWNQELKSMLIERMSSVSTDFSIIKEEFIEDKNWNEEWEKRIKPFVVSPRIGITPERYKDTIDTDIKIIINPKMSFGTGEHATTRLVCSLMEDIVKPGQFWIDAGTGTGILAILAVKLGADSAYAFDNNIWSIENSIENVAMNGVSDKIKIEEADIDEIVLPKSDCIAANLFLHLLLPSLPKFYNSLIDKHGDLIVSGILKYNREEVIEEAQKQGFTLIKSAAEDEWVAIHFQA